MNGLPFTVEQFLQVFARYNETLWPAVVLWWLATLTVVLVAWRIPDGRRWVTWLLAALWAWNGLAYHAWLFTIINPAAWVFAGLFLVEAALLASAGRRSAPLLFCAIGWRRSLGVALTAYAFVYPFLTIATGHRWPAAPTFGVPCPTAILTIGLLLTIPLVPIPLTVIPVLWAFVGGSAAYLLGVPTDYPLLGAGLLLAGAAVRQAYLARLIRISPQ
jgi:hypothetical protein